MVNLVRKHDHRLVERRRREAQSELLAQAEAEGRIVDITEEVMNGRKGDDSK